MTTINFCPYCGTPAAGPTPLVQTDNDDRTRCHACGETFTVVDPDYLDALREENKELEDFGGEGIERDDSRRILEWYENFSRDVRAVLKEHNPALLEEMRLLP